MSSCGSLSSESWAALHGLVLRMLLRVLRALLEEPPAGCVSAAAAGGAPPRPAASLAQLAPSQPSTLTARLHRVVVLLSPSGWDILSPRPWPGSIEHRLCSWREERFRCDRVAVRDECPSRDSLLSFLSCPSAISPCISILLTCSRPACRCVLPQLLRFGCLSHRLRYTMAGVF